MKLDIVRGAVLLTLCTCTHVPPPAQTTQPQRAFMESMIERDPAAEPRLVFLLLGHYGATNQSRAGLTFFERVLAEHRGLDSALRALYLGAIGALRAQTAEEIPLLRRVAWVERGIGELDESVRLSDGMFITRWLRANVLAQLPDRFEREEMALQELRWLEANLDDAPAPGLDREVLYLRAVILRRRGEGARAQALLARSGYSGFDRRHAMNTPFQIDPRRGFAFSSPEVRELVPGRVHQVLGRDFMEHYFVRTAGGAATIAIDAGSSADATARALAAYREVVAGAPPITTVLVTHSHWTMSVATSTTAGWPLLRPSTRAPVIASSSPVRRATAVPTVAGGEAASASSRSSPFAPTRPSPSALASRSTARRSR